MQNTVPEWLFLKESYVPKKDHDNFIKRTEKAILKVFSKFRFAPVRRKKELLPAELKLVLMLVLLLAISLSKTGGQLLVIAAFVFLLEAFQSGEILKRIFKGALMASIFTLVIVTPNFFVTKSYKPLMLVIKVFFSVSSVYLFHLTTEWNRITRGLKRLHVPSVFLFVLEMAIKYIGILGEVSLNMVEALLVRSIGKNRKKYETMSSILGTTYLKSREISEEMFEAMECRGFTGDFNENN